MINKKLNFYGPINTLGYGISSYNLWKNLRESVSTTLFPINEVTIEKHWNQKGLVDDIKNQLDYDITSPCLKVWHANDMIIRPYNKNLYAGYTFFEIDKVTQQERLGYDILDIIYVPSKWAKNILIDNGIDHNKIIVAPAGVDIEVFDYSSYNDLLEDKEEGTYIFLNIGKWEIRKGHDLLVHMFNQAFTEKDNVELWMLNSNPFLSSKENQQWNNLYKNSKLGDKIKILPRLPTQKDIAKVIKLSDCGIYPSRAEGWNNEVIETMAMDRPVITTNYSAHTEYCDKSNSFLVEAKNLESADDGKFFDCTGQWASLDGLLDNFIDYMKYVYSNKINTNKAGLKTASKFNWTKTTDKIIETLYG